MSVSFSGLSSGLNTDQIIQQLLAIERRPQQRFSSEQDRIEQKQSAFQDLNSRISSLEGNVETLTSDSTFNQLSIDNNKPKVLSASIINQDAVQEGIFDIFVEQLATTAKIKSGQQIQDQNMVAQGSITSISDFELVEGSDTVDFDGTNSTQSMLNQLSNEVQTSGDAANEFTINGTGFDLDSFSNFAELETAIENNTTNLDFGFDQQRDKFFLTPTNQNGSGGDSFTLDDVEGVISDNSKGFLQQIGFNADETATTFDERQSSSGQNLLSIDSSRNLQDNRFTSSLTNPSSTNTIQINNTELSFDPTSDTINDVVNQITNQVEGVNASFNSATDKITLQTENTGSGSIDVEDVSGNLADVLNLRTENPPGAGQTQASEDAGTDSEITVDGDTVTGEGNTITFNGIQLDLKDVLKESNNPDDPVTLEIGKDFGSVTQDVQTFIDQFNSVIEFINQRNNSNPASGPDGQRGESGPFANDSTIRRIRDRLVSIVTDRFKDATGSDSIQDAGSVGIEQKDPLTATDSDINKLNFDSGQFRQALENAPNAVEDLFTADTADGDSADGIATELESFIEDGVIDDLNGIIPSRIEGFDRQIEDLQERIRENEERVQERREQLEARFSQMEQLLTQLNSQRSFINARL